MADQISNYRQVRLVLQVPALPGGRTYFSLHALGVRRGIPTSVILADGTVPSIRPDCTSEEIWAALAAVVTQHQLKG